MERDIGTKIFANIFEKDNIEYKIPFFQRGYVWNSEQQKTLLNDIIEFLKTIDVNIDHDRSNNLEKIQENKYFFGPVVVKRQEIKGDKIRYIIIDGQQRFTTVYILTALINSLLREKNNTGDDPNVSDYLKKLDPFITNSYDSKSDFSKLKILSSKGDIKATYQAIYGESVPIITSEDEKYMLNMDSSTNKITLMKKFWEKKLKLLSSQELYIYSILLLYSFEVVWIVLDDNQDEQAIFESLNDKGTPLTGAELICNYLFLSFKKEQGDCDKLHYEKWLNNELRINKRRSNIFGTDADYSTFENYIRFLFSINRKKMLPIGNNYRLTYYEFKKEYPDLRINEQRSKELLDKIHKNTSIFCDIIDPIDNRLENREILSPFTHIIRKLLLTQTNSVIMFLLSLFMEYKHKQSFSQNEMSQILNITYSMIIRGRIIKRNFKYDTFFPSLTSELLKNQNKVDIYKELIRKNNFYVEDDILKRAFKENSLYSNARSQKSFCQFILKELDKYVANQENSGEQANFETTNTIEHILPQDLKEEKGWSAYIIEAEQEHPNYKNILHSIGNLFLISQKRNSSGGNNAFTTKKEVYQGNPTALYQDLIQNTSGDWNLNLIQERSERLADYAIKLWGYS